MCFSKKTDKVCPPPPPTNGGHTIGNSIGNSLGNSIGNLIDNSIVNSISNAIGNSIGNAIRTDSDTHLRMPTNRESLITQTDFHMNECTIT